VRRSASMAFNSSF